MDEQTIKPIPKRAVMINLMFACEDDAKALELKAIIDKAVANIEEKRYTFQFIQN